MIQGWWIVAVVAIVAWGIVSLTKARAGIISDEDGNETYVGGGDDTSKAELAQARLEIEELRDRVHVLERIATDNNSVGARERERIAAEIESLRTPGEVGTDKPQSLTKEDQSK